MTDSELRQCANEGDCRMPRRSTAGVIGILWSTRPGGDRQPQMRRPKPVRVLRSINAKDLLLPKGRVKEVFAVSERTLGVR